MARPSEFGKYYRRTLFSDRLPNPTQGDFGLPTMESFPTHGLSEPQNEQIGGTQVCSGWMCQSVESRFTWSGTTEIEDARRKFKRCRCPSTNTSTNN